MYRLSCKTSLLFGWLVFFFGPVSLGMCQDIDQSLASGPERYTRSISDAGSREHTNDATATRNIDRTSARSGPRILIDE